jgi:hypothetical protein
MMNYSNSYPVLEPLGVGELLDRAIRLYRNNFLKFIGIVSIVQIPLTLIQLLTSYLMISSSSEMIYGETDILGTYTAGLGATILTAILSFVLIQGVAIATLTRSISDSYLGQPRDVISTLKSIGPLWPRILLALLGIGFLTIGIGIWTLVPCAGWLTGLGMLFFITTAVTPMVVPIIVIEKRGANSAIRRAWELVRRRFWWVLGFMLLLSIFAQLIITVPTTLINLIVSSLTSGSPDLMDTYSTAQLISETTVSLATSLIYLPFRLVAVTLLYFDLRIRTEGFDLAILAQQESRSAQGLQVAPLETPYITEKQLVTNTEIGYFILVTIIAAVLYGLLVLLGGFIGLASMGGLGGF